jgi:hypothetical protein
MIKLCKKRPVPINFCDIREITAKWTKLSMIAMAVYYETQKKDIRN